MDDCERFSACTASTQLITLRVPAKKDKFQRDVIALLFRSLQLHCLDWLLDTSCRAAVTDNYELRDTR